MTDEEVLELARTAGDWLFDRRERLEKHDRDGIAFLWLHVSEIETFCKRTGRKRHGHRNPENVS